MKKILVKIHAWPKPLIALFLAGFLLTSPLAVPQADAWFPGADAVIAEKMREVYETIQAFMVGAAKQAAIQSLNQEVSFLVTGRSSQGVMFVTDWKDYLVTQPDRQAKLYMNAYIDQITAGRGSLSQYIPAGSEGFGLAGGNYINSLRVGAQNGILNPTQPVTTYVGNPSQMFASGNFRNLSLYLSGINNPWAFNLNVQQKLDETRQTNQLAAQTRSIAGQGFPGTDINGKTVTPGIVTKENLVNVQKMGLDSIANAQNMPAIITAIVSKIITTSITQGIGTMQNLTHREVVNVQNQTNTQMNSAIGAYGPGAQYTPTWMVGAAANKP